MSPIDVCGVFILAYATCIAVWTLCERQTAAALRALASAERPSALPRLRCGEDAD